MHKHLRRPLRVEVRRPKTFDIVSAQLLVIVPVRPGEEEEASVNGVGRSWWEAANVARVVGEATDIVETYLFSVGWVMKKGNKVTLLRRKVELIEVYIDLY